MSHHLLASDCTKMALAELNWSKQKIGLKSVACTKAFVSSAKAQYQVEMWLVPPLLEKGGKTCKNMKEGHDNYFWIRK